MLRSVVLGGCLSMALTLPVFAQSALPPETVKTAAEPLKAQQAPEKSKRLFAQLKQQALYDPTTKASYVFSKPLQDGYLDALMQKENIYYADPHSLVVQIDDESTLATFQKA